jgi:ribosomal protein L40E
MQQKSHFTRMGAGRHQKSYERILSKLLHRRITDMVYCTRCGTQNPDSAVNCSNCGAPLYPENPPYTRHEYHRYYREEHRHQGSGIGLLIAGLFIVIIGLAALTNNFWVIWTYFWPVVLILIGVWILLLGLKRNRRYSQAST